MFSEIGRGTRITVSDREEGDVPLVTAGEKGQGITEYIKENKELFNQDAITIDMFGNTFYRGYEFFADDNIIIVRNNKLNRYVLQYICGSMQWLKYIYSYSKQFRMKELDKTIIELPVLTSEDTEPYWDYMTYYIHNIQQQYADQLEAKSEYELDLMCQILGVTRDDIAQRMEYQQPQYTNTFKANELFGINRGDISNQGNLVETGVKEGVAFIAQNDSNNGYVKQVESENYKVFKGRNIVIGRQTGAVYYQDEEFVTTDGVLVLSSKHILDKEIGLYLVTILKKHLENSGYNNTVSATKLNKIELELPVLGPNSKEIDWSAISLGTVGGGSTIWLLVKRYATEILR